MTTVFDWFDHHISTVNNIINLLNIGKGLKQCVSEAEEQNIKFYKLTGLSETRFSAYLERSLSNFLKSLPIIVEVLKTRTESKDKNTRDEASTNLRYIHNKTFILVHMGLIDIYRQLGTYSCLLQTVEQFPWTIRGKLNNLITTLRFMEEIKLTSNLPITAKVADTWPTLMGNINDVLTDKYKDLKTDIFAELRRGRSSDDAGDTVFTSTVENRLSSLCRNLANQIEARTLNDDNFKWPNIFNSMKECFDLNHVQNSQTKEFGEKELEDVIKASCTGVKTASLIREEYKIFKERFKSLLKLKEKDQPLYLRNNEHFLYETHQCNLECNVDHFKDCPNFKRITNPKKIIPIKWFHLFLREADLYSGLENFLHLFLRSTMKTHAEGAAESMGKVIEIHSSKYRGMDIQNVGVESKIHWNGPPVHYTKDLAEATLDRIFGGRSKWHFVTKISKRDSVVTSRLKSERPKLPFY